LVRGCVKQPESQRQRLSVEGGPAHWPPSFFSPEATRIMPTKKASTAKKDPCWKGYEQEGTKKKDGKTVPNCVKKD
jgi:hypothetical protein